MRSYKKELWFTTTKRREFIKKSVLGSAGIAIGGMGFTSKSYASVVGANERINLAVVGIRNQGSVHIETWCSLKDKQNVNDFYSFANVTAANGTATHAMSIRPKTLFKTFVNRVDYRKQFFYVYI